MNKKAVVFLLSMCFLPLMIFFGYYLFEASSDMRSRREIYLSDYQKIQYNFKIDKIYRDKREHNALTLKGNKIRDIATSPPEWERGIFQKGDSIVKQKGSLKVYVYKNNKLDTILDYNNIYIKM